MVPLIQNCVRPSIILWRTALEPWSALQIHKPWELGSLLVFGVAVVGGPLSLARTPGEELQSTRGGFCVVTRDLEEVLGYFELSYGQIMIILVRGLERVMMLPGTRWVLCSRILAAAIMLELRPASN